MFVIVEKKCGHHELTTWLDETKLCRRCQIKELLSFLSDLEEEREDLRGIIECTKEFLLKKLSEMGG